MSQKTYETLMHPKPHTPVLDSKSFLLAHNSRIALDINKTSQPWLCSLDFKAKNGNLKQRLSPCWVVEGEIQWVSEEDKISSMKESTYKSQLTHSDKSDKKKSKHFKPSEHHHPDIDDNMKGYNSEQHSKKKDFYPDLPKAKFSRGGH